MPERHGLPHKEFFIWSDDIEFTARVLRHEPGYFVPDSVAVHKTETAHLPWEGGERFYYAVRNGVWMALGDASARGSARSTCWWWPADTPLPGLRALLAPVVRDRHRGLADAVRRPRTAAR